MSNSVTEVFVGCFNSAIDLNDHELPLVYHHFQVNCETSNSIKDMKHSIGSSQSEASMSSGDNYEATMKRLKYSTGYQFHNSICPNKEITETESTIKKVGVL